jgi:hypothetical protein
VVINVRAADGDRDLVLELGGGAGSDHGEAVPGATASQRSAQWDAFTCGRATESRSGATRRRERDRRVQRADWAEA